MSSNDFSKIEREHLQRLAYVYIRQSSLHQVQFNTASTARQYNLVDRVKELGWPDERIIRCIVGRARRLQDHDERHFDGECRSCIQFGGVSVSTRFKRLAPTGQTLHHS